MRRQSAQGGYTLIEIAMVLVIIGLVVTPFLHVYTTSKKQEQVTTTKREVADIQYALEAYIRNNNRLPCPADPSISVTASGWGAEVTCPAGLGTAPTGGVKTVTTASGDKVWIGSLPVSAINLANEYATDSWSGRYTYAVSRKLTVPGSIPNPADQPLGSISVIDEHGQNILQTADAARFVIFSHGIDKAGGYTEEGVKIACPAVTSPTEVGEGENCNDDSTFVVSAVYNGDGAIQTDDYGISDMTVTSVSVKKPAEMVVRCTAKGMFYAPKYTNPLPDADGCIPPPDPPQCPKNVFKPYRCIAGKFWAFNDDGTYTGYTVSYNLCEPRTYQWSDVVNGKLPAR